MTQTNKISIAITIICIYTVVSLAAGYWLAKLPYDPTTQSFGIPGTNPVTFGNWVYSSIAFFGGLFAFAVPGIPAAFTYFWWLLTVILALDFISMFFPGGGG